MCKCTIFFFIAKCSFFFMSETEAESKKWQLQLHIPALSPSFSCLPFHARQKINKSFKKATFADAHEWWIRVYTCTVTHPLALSESSVPRNAFSRLKTQEGRSENYVAETCPDRDLLPFPPPPSARRVRVKRGRGFGLFKWPSWAGFTW